MCAILYVYTYYPLCRTQSLSPICTMLYVYIVLSYYPLLQNTMFTTNVSGLHFSWGGFVDPHSPIIFYRVAVGTTPGEQDIWSWQDVGMARGMLLK